MTRNCNSYTLNYLVLRTVLSTAPDFVASKFVPNLIPQWVDDEFIAELRNVLLTILDVPIKIGGEYVCKMPQRKVYPSSVPDEAK